MTTPIIASLMGCLLCMVAGFYFLDANDNENSPDRRASSGTTGAVVLVVGVTLVIWAVV